MGRSEATQVVVNVQSHDRGHQSTCASSDNFICCIYIYTCGSESREYSCLKLCVWCFNFARNKTRFSLFFFIYCLLDIQIVPHSVQTPRLKNAVSLSTSERDCDINGECVCVCMCRKCQSQIHPLYGLQHALHSRHGQAVSGAAGCRHQAPRHAATR